MPSRFSSASAIVEGEGMKARLLRYLRSEVVDMLAHWGAFLQVSAESWVLHNSGIGIGVPCLYTMSLNRKSNPIEISIIL